MVGDSMRSRKTVSITILLAVLGVLLLAEFTLANPTAPTALSRVKSSNRDLSALPAKSLNAIAGNVTQVSIDALSVTKSWQGYYGNVSGVITLDNANNDTFYNWSVTSTKGRIYATNVSSITWSGVACSSASDISTAETGFGQSASDSDSISNTFDNTTSTHPAFSVGSVQIGADSCYATNAFGSSGAQSSQFFQVLLNQGSNIIFTTLMNGSQTGFDNSSWDFELLVAENGHNGDTSVTPYYFWVELD